MHRMSWSDACGVSETSDGPGPTEREGGFPWRPSRFRVPSGSPFLSGQASSWRRSSLRPLLHVDILHPARSSTSGCSWFQTPQDTMLARHPLQPQPGGAWRTAWWRTWPEGLPWAPSQGFTGSAFSRGRWKALFFISTAVPNLAGTRDWFRGRQLFHGWCGQGMVSG